MNNIPYFSIVVPVYRVEQYLKNCVDSILAQNCDNFELILVDDGSPDKCPEICDRYVKDDLRVTVIHKTNGGLSSARNAGIKAARGKYIIFVDSDDYWNSDKALSILYDKLNREKQIDVLLYNSIDYSCVTGKSIVCNRYYDIDFVENSDKADVLKYLFNNNLLPGAAWATVTRRELLTENNLYFIDGIKAEDIDWILKVFLQANTYSALNEAFYVYLKYRNDSITGTADAKSIDYLLYQIELWQNKIETQEYWYISNEVKSLLSRHYISALLIFGYIETDKRTEYRKKLKTYKYMLNYSKIPIIRFVKIIPIDVISTLLNVYRNIIRNR